MLSNILKIEPCRISLWKMFMGKDSFRVSKSMADLERDSRNNFFNLLVEKRMHFFVEILPIENVFADGFSNKVVTVRDYEEKWKNKLLSAFGKKIGSNVLTKVKELLPTSSTVDSSTSDLDYSFLVKGFSFCCGIDAINNGGRSLDEPERSELLQVLYLDESYKAIAILRL